MQIRKLAHAVSVLAHHFLWLGLLSFNEALIAQIYIAWNHRKFNELLIGKDVEGDSRTLISAAFQEFA
jgi:hypothetical protein